MTRLEDALEALELGAGALGFVFYPPSPRYLTFQQAEAIVKKLPVEGEKVGVFVKFNLEEAEKIALQIGLTGVQIYEPQSIPRKDLLHILAFRISKNLPDLNRYSWADYFLLDSFSSQCYGGSGQRFNWKLLGQEKFNRPLILAGGLTPENVSEAILTTNVDAVDVSSGVETSPGIKDKVKLKKFIQQANLAFSERKVFKESKDASR